MNLQIISDLHYEAIDISYNEIPIVGDVLIIAGDYHYAALAIDNIAKKFSDIPIVYIAGNHEHYTANCSVTQSINYLRSKSKEHPNIHFLENESKTIKDVTFLGCTLWTDFDLLNDATMHSLQAEIGMNDFRKISSEIPGETLKISEWLTYNSLSYSFLRNSLLEKNGKKTVVVTHYGPSIKSINPIYRNSVLNPAFASNYEDLLYLGPSLWIHGHTHSKVDYIHNNTRVVGNPAGYMLRNGLRENREFNPTFTVKI